VQQISFFVKVCILMNNFRMIHFEIAFRYFGISVFRHEISTIFQTFGYREIFYAANFQYSNNGCSFVKFLNWPTWRRCRMSSSVRLPFCRPGETAAMAAAAVVLAVACVVVVVSSGLSISHGTNIQAFAHKLYIKKSNRPSRTNR
jgi:hypothetical protein